MSVKISFDEAVELIASTVRNEHTSSFAFMCNFQTLKHWIENEYIENFQAVKIKQK
jgi:uncharacterized protein YoaH (UPF0181 family)